VVGALAAATGGLAAAQRAAGAAGGAVKTKTIKALLRKKVDAWLATIEDEPLRRLAAENTIVTGGSIASMLLGEPVNDFDLYFRTRATALALANYYVARFKVAAKKGAPCAITVLDTEERIKIVIKSAGIASADGTQKPYEYFEARPEGEAAGYVSEVMTDPGDAEERYEETEAAALKTDDKPPYRPVFLSTNAITLAGQVQLVLRFFGDPEAIHENYDFVHCTNYWSNWDEQLVLRQPALESLLAKDLRYVGSLYPVCSVMRLRKFIKRGWAINAGQILKILMQVSALDLTDPKILEDQLTGVDCAYFMEVLEKLKDKDPEKVSTAYLCEIIDRMF
jgi:hypothetical protein